MKVVITGHTKGLGKAIYDELSSDHEVLGLSRSNGHDIESLDCEQFKDFDAFINNTYHPIAQYRLLRDFYEIWKQSEKTIINVGSAGLNLPNRPLKFLSYNSSKVQLENYSRWISDYDSKCRCMLFSPGHMDTDLMSEVAEEWGPEAVARHAQSSLNTGYCARIVRLMLESPYTIRDLQLVP